MCVCVRVCVLAHDGAFMWRAWCLRPVRACALCVRACVRLGCVRGGRVKIFSSEVGYRPGPRLSRRYHLGRYLPLHPAPEATRCCR